MVIRVRCQPVPDLPISRRVASQPFIKIRLINIQKINIHQVQTGPYQLPGWEDSVRGFHERFDSWFGGTPPTALIFSESKLFLWPLAEQDRLKPNAFKDSEATLAHA